MAAHSGASPPSGASRPRRSSTRAWSMLRATIITFAPSMPPAARRSGHIKSRVASRSRRWRRPAEMRRRASSSPIGAGESRPSNGPSMPRSWRPPGGGSRPRGCARRWASRSAPPTSTSRPTPGRRPRGCGRRWAVRSGRRRRWSSRRRRSRAMIQQRARRCGIRPPSCTPGCGRRTRPSGRGARLRVVAASRSSPSRSNMSAWQ